uniref:Nucleoporin NUP188 homolog n=1 Tax=Cannabis sativa TaxID=3483 RepID=A0A803NF80_CANSA
MANPKSVEPSLWWDPFSLLLTEIEQASPSCDLPPSLLKKLKDNHYWFVDTVSCFKPPNEKSREALNSQQLKIGSHQLKIQPELKDKALQISPLLCLDEVQSYILVERSFEKYNVVLDSIVQEFPHVALLQYYIERQCLLKCTRRILMHALSLGNGSRKDADIWKEALNLISDGLEEKLVAVLQELLSSIHPAQMDVDLFTLWAEETLIEDYLVLDILFLTYYESFCICNGQRWKTLCSLFKGILSGSYNLRKLEVSTEAIQSSYQAKIQLLLVLIETLDLENLLQMVHDETPFREVSSHFSLIDVQEMDTIVSSLNAFETKEAGPLILTWAVFLCLISSLPGKEENNVLMEIDHISYVRQAFEAASLRSFLEILESYLLNESDGPVAGYRGVLRTFISAFIASYEINIQLEDSTLNLILDILCKVYRGEESLCIQFWDRESFVDGPIRCLLCSLEGEFPFRIVELIRLLSSLSEGTWPAECVYNFLDKSVGISSLFEITDDSLVDATSQIVETRAPLHVPGIEGLLIPSSTRGHILKLIGPNTALVRWEYTHSGVLVLLLRLAQGLYLDGNEEALLTLDLLNQMISSNEAVCFALMDIGNSFHAQETALSGQLESRVWVVEIICTLVRKLSPNPGSAAIMAIGVNILAKMLKCCPSYIAAAAVKANLFDVALNTNILDTGSNNSLSGSWLLSGKLATMLLIDCEQNENNCFLTTAVLDFTMQLMETGFENDTVLALVVFSLQYVLVNHEYWKFKVKHSRWRITLKVLELIKKGIAMTSYSGKLVGVIWDMLLSDSSIHSTLFRIVCTTSQALEKLHVSRLFDVMEIEGLSLAISSVLEILYNVLAKFPKDTSSSLPIFLQSVLSSATKPISVVAAVVSLVSYFRNPGIQIGATKVLSMLLMTADFLPAYFSASSFGLDDKQVTDLKDSVSFILLEQSEENEDLFVATVNLFTAAARYQPAFFIAVFANKENMDVQASNAGGGKLPAIEVSSGAVESKDSSLVDAVLCYIVNSDSHINNKPFVLLNVLNFLKALWERAAQYINILARLKSSEKFWKQLSKCVPLTSPDSLPDSLTEMEALNQAYRYQCQSSIMEIMAYDMFLQKKLSQVESQKKQVPESKGSFDKSKAANLYDHRDVLSTWCHGSVLVNLIKLLTTYDYDNKSFYHAEVSASLVTVHLIEKVTAGDTGSLSVSILQKISTMSKKLRSHPAFSELLAQYSQSGYSEGKELNNLILNDLYYHLEGELEGREISAGPFKELSEYLVDSKVMHNYQHKYDNDFLITYKDVYLFDPERVRADLGSDLWDYLKWKTSKEITKRMLSQMMWANSTVLLRNSKLAALKSLITVLTIYENDEKNATLGGISNELIRTCIDHICKGFRDTVESLAPYRGSGSEDTFHFLSAQSELLLHLLRSAHKSLNFSVCVHLLKTAGSGLRVLCDFRPSATEVNITIKLLLVLLLSTVEFCCLSSHFGGMIDKESVEDMAKISNVCLGLLPILCNCIVIADHCTLSLTTVDLILRNFLTPNSWFPVIQSHLQLNDVILKLQDKSSFSSVPVVMKFFLTLARVREGAEMLVNYGFLSSLRFLFTEYMDGRPLSISTDKLEKPQQVWGLALAVITAMVESLGDSPSCRDILDNVIPYLFSEKGYIISYYLSAPDFPSDDHDKKRPRTQRTEISLSALKETEHTIMLMCVLARHWKSWVKAIKEMDSQLREQSIHLLAFISKGSQRLGDSSSINAPLLCPPVLKEEFDNCNKPSFMNSKNGWFALSPLGCVSRPKFSAVSTTSTSLIIRSQPAESANHAAQTYFSDVVSLEIYRISFLLLKFLCLQVDGAARRAEEVGYVDLAHFPELPMPGILHGLQDQAISIVAELCEANKLNQIKKEIQNACCLLLQIMEMALYLELCVLQICGMRPVLGRVEDFSKEVKKLLRATEGHAFLKSSVKSLKQIISFVYPGLLQTEELM